YFSDVVVAADNPARSFRDLRGGVWAYNDVCSLSGFHCLLRRIDPDGAGRHFFRAMRVSGAHHVSIDWVARGLADAAAIDSNGLRLAFAREPELRSRIRVLESWGPHPIQPIAARADLPVEMRRAVAAALLELGRDLDARTALAAYGVRGFTPVDDSLYAAERAALRSALPPEAALAAFV